MIHKQAQNNFNIRATALIDKLITQETQPTGKPESIGSNAEIYALDWSDKIDTDRASSHRSFNGITGEKSDIFCNIDGKEYGFVGQHYREFQQLTKSIFEVNEIAQKVDYSFVETELFNWIIEVKLNAQLERECCSFLIDKINSVCDDWTVAFPVLYLSIPNRLSIGDAWFDYTRKKEVEEFIKGKDKKDKEAARNLYGNLVYVATKVKKCSRSKAEDIAIERCSLAVDILKCFSPTKEIPKVPLHFDIDKRTRINRTNTSYIFKENFFDELSLHLIPSVGQRMSFSDEIFTVIRKTPLKVLNESKRETNEIRRVVKMNISRFANALSTSDLSERIVQLASIWDSIFVSDENEPVQYTITRYGTKLVANSRNERIQVKKIVKNMYAHRSAFLHRAKRLNLSNEELTSFQDYTLKILYAFTFLSFSYDTVKEVLQLIDEEIEAAFNIESLDLSIPKH